MNIQELYTLFVENPNISTDSRKQSEGAIFFALKGDRFNGNEFAGAALDNGCSYAVVDDKSQVKDDRYILADNALQCLQELASFHRGHFTIPIIGITGTNGKTTTKELTSKVLERKYSVLSTRGNLNNEIGVPLTLLSLSGNTEIAVVEMGANHIGEIKQLCQIARPTHGLITNIGVAHLEGFGTRKNVRKAKAELYDFLEETGGVVFYDEKNEVLNTMLQDRRIEKVPYCDDRLFRSDFPETGQPYLLSMTLNHLGNELQIHTRLAGRYNVSNVMASIRTGDYFNVGVHQIIEAIESYVPENNRSQIVHTKHNTILLDAYNANPTSMVLAIDDFLRDSGPNGILILGDMLELGDTALEEHKKLVAKLDGCSINDVILVGAVFNECGSGGMYKTFQTVDDLISWLKRNPLRSREIFIKGSRKIGLERIIDSL
jgi:UDP-N-acetylmuramoyl-tripeptide--D-alanyl-D-alanine ligase